MLNYLWWRHSGRFDVGLLFRRLRAATGACRRLRMVSHSVRCRFATIIIPRVGTHGSDPVTATRFYVVCYVSVGYAPLHPRLESHHRLCGSKWLIFNNYELFRIQNFQ